MPMKGRGLRRAPRRSKQPGESFEDLLGAHGQRGDGHAIPSSSSDEAAIVISISSGRCRVFDRGVEIDCLIPSALAARQKSALAVGDRVRVSGQHDGARLGEVLARSSVLARPDPLNPHMQRLVAANIDAVVQVVTLRSPPLRPRLIDRYLIAIQRGRAQPVLCVNKVDLVDAGERPSLLESLDPYRDLGVPIVVCSAKTGEGIDDLREAVEGKLVALVGHSGVGKSSLLNALDERLRITTREVHKRGTGRHTTSASTLYDFGDGTYLIDTPGIREFGISNLGRDSLRDYFPEFDVPSESCRFNDCVHVHEPDCEIRTQVEHGLIHRARYETYLRLYEDLGETVR